MTGVQTCALPISIEVSVNNYVDASKLKQIYYDVRDDGKFSLLVHLLKQEKSHLVMIFCNTRRNTDFVANNLNNNGISEIGRASCRERV